MKRPGITEKALQKARSGNPEEQWLSPADALARRRDLGPVTATGFLPLDRQLRRGGLPGSSVVRLIGPPEAGKTTILCSMLIAVAQAPLPVFAIFSDEGRTQAAVRLGAQLGFDRDKLDSNDEDEVQRFLDATPPIFLLGDPDTPGTHLQSLFDLAHKHVKDGDRAIIALDSVQTVRADRSRDETKNSAIARLMELVRNTANSTGWIFLMTSQSNREGYRKKKKEDRADPISTGAGASEIEYAADVQLNLDRPDDLGVVAAEISKNRLMGSKVPFVLRYSEEGSRMLEVDKAHVDEEKEEKAKEENRSSLDKAKKRVLEVLQKHPKISSAKIASLVTGRRSNVLLAISELEKEGTIIDTAESQKTFAWEIR